MVELLFIYTAVVFISVGFFSLGRVLGTRLPVISTVLCAFLLVFGGIMCWMTAGDLRWAVFAPMNIAHLMSYSPALLVVYSAGSLSVNQTVHARSRAMLSGLLCLAVAALIVGGLLRPACQPPLLAEQSIWSGGVCLQSHESSCAPAAAANLLHLHGLEFGERELADFAQTSLCGTPPIGSFLAVSQAVEGTELKACIQLRGGVHLVQYLPMLAHVRFDKSRVSASNSSGLCSKFLHGIRARSEGHAVVIVERCKEGWVVADPAAGKVIWSDAQLAECWNGEGVYLSAK